MVLLLDAANSGERIELRRIRRVIYVDARWSHLSDSDRVMRTDDAAQDMKAKMLQHHPRFTEHYVRRWPSVPGPDDWRSCCQSCGWLARGSV